MFYKINFYVNNEAVFLGPFLSAKENKQTVEIKTASFQNQRRIQ